MTFTCVWESFCYCVLNIYLRFIMLTITQPY